VIRRQHKGQQVRLTFVLDNDSEAGAVSVVGDFNEWTPGAHPLTKRSNGTRSVVVSVPTGGEFRFRYLGEGGRWFDDEDADHHDHDGGLVRT
jgi:1,4-alpha-glucan branching enzyme